MKWVAVGAVFLSSFFLVALTISDYGLTWDEPHYFHAADLHVQWLSSLGRGVVNGRMAQSLQDEAIVQAWHWDPSHVPHPPFSRILSGLSKALFSPPLDRFVAFRLPSAVFFALLVTGMYLWMSEVYDRATGFLSAATTLAMPHLFGHAHFAMTDMPLTALWFLAAYAFWKGLEDWRWSIAVGVLWGFALATKFPGFLVPIPLIVWAHLYRRRDYHNNVVSMAFLSPLVMVGCNPYLWHQTLPRLAQFVYESASRGFRPGTNFAIFFLHEYHRSSTLPWYYGFLMTMLTIPETILFLAAVGSFIVCGCVAQRELRVLFGLSAGFILISGLVPGAVLHDVNRLMLPALPFLVGLAGCGFFALTTYLMRWSQKLAPAGQIRHMRLKLVSAVAVVALFLPIAELLIYHPYELSYFNRLIGGVRGAYEKGLEVTYLMEAFTPQVLRSLNDEMPANAIVNASFSNFMLHYYQRHDRLRKDIRITDGTDFDYYILLNRPSAYRRDASVGVRDPTLYADDWGFVSTQPSLHRVWHIGGAPLILMFVPRR